MDTITYMPLGALAANLGLPQKFLREAADAGNIPCLVIGGRRRFEEGAVRKALRRMAARQAKTRGRKAVRLEAKVLER